MEFRNNNREIIRYIADETYRRNKGRNRILTCTAAFAVILVFCVFSFAAEKLETEAVADMRRSGEASGYSLLNPEEEQYEKIKTLSYIRYTGRVWTFAAAEKEEAPVFFCTCFSEKTFEQVYKPAVTDLSGSFPKRADQIMLSKKALENLNIKRPKLGMKIRLKLIPWSREQQSVKTDGKERNTRTETFTLSGYFTDYRSSYVRNEIPNAIFSTQYLKKQPAGGAVSCELWMLPKEVFYDWDKQQKQEKKLQKDAEIKDEQQLEGYFIGSGRKARIQTYLEAAVISFFVLLLAGLLIHNVTGISIQNSIRHYGMLKTLGATEKQIRKILHRQIVRIAFPGAFLGAAAGVVLAAFLFPELLEALYLLDLGTADDIISLHPELLAASVLLVILITMVSAMSPARKVSRLSPMETQSWKKRSAENRKKSTLAILTMSIGILAALVSAMITEGFDDKKEIEKQPDFSVFAWVYRTYRTADENFPIIDKKTEEAIRSISGVKAIRSTYVSYLFLDEKEAVWRPLGQDTGRRYGSLLLIKEECLEKLEQYAKKKGAAVDFEGVRAGRSAIALHANELSQKQEQQAEAMIGTNFQITDAAGTKKGNLNFAGYLNRADKSFPDMNLPMHSAHEPILLAAKAGFVRAGLKPEIQDMELTTDEAQEPAVKKRLQEILKTRERFLWKESENRDFLELYAKSDLRQENWAKMAARRLMAYGITILFMLLGMLNYINTIVTDLLSRRRELALLECAGMTRKQLKRMLIKEGLRYSLSAIGLSAVEGILLLPALLKAIRLKEYTFPFVCPWTEFAGMSALMLICSILIPLLVYRKESKETIAERLRHTG